MDKKIKKISEIEEGDTFLLKIENSEDKKLNGRYFVIIYTIIPFWEKLANCFSCRIKITKDKNKPQTKEEIDGMEYVKVAGIMPFERFSFYGSTESIEIVMKEQSKVPFVVNDHGIIDTYVYEIFMGRKSLFKTLEYIGNFNIAKPKDEFIPFHRAIKGCDAAYIKYLEEKLLRSYRLYNLKQSAIYDSQKSEEVKERLYKYFLMNYNIHKYLIEREDESKRIPELEYFFREKPNEKIKENHLTYVGGGEDPCKKRKSKKAKKEEA